MTPQQPVKNKVLIPTKYKSTLGDDLKNRNY